MSASVTPYTSLITSEHADKPNFVATVSNSVQPFADLIALLGESFYDLDSAVGAQLDVIGQWVGVTRYVKTPITGVFFSLDIYPGLDDGIVWDSVTEPDEQLTTLPDDEYRILLRVRILNNQWDGTFPTLYAILLALFTPAPNTNALSPFVQDNNDLSLYVGFTGKKPTPVIQALLTQGALDIKPAGVQVRNYVYPSQDGPLFALDVNNTYFAGLDLGVWGTLS